MTQIGEGYQSALLETAGNKLAGKINSAAATLKDCLRELAPIRANSEHKQQIASQRQQNLAALRAVDVIRGAKLGSSAIRQSPTPRAAHGSYVNLS